LKHLIFSIWLCGLALYAGAQDSILLERYIPGSYIRMAVDPLQQLFLLRADGQLKKCNLKGDSLAVFNEFVQFGKKAMLDVSNPLRCLLYYPEFLNLLLLPILLLRACFYCDAVLHIILNSKYTNSN